MLKRFSPPPTARVGLLLPHHTFRTSTLTPRFLILSSLVCLT